MFSARVASENKYAKRIVFVDLQYACIGGGAEKPTIWGRMRFLPYIRMITIAYNLHKILCKSGSSEF